MGYEIPEINEPSPIERFLKVTKRLVNSNYIKWGLLFRKLGTEGMVDQKRQLAMFFGKNTIKHLDTVINPNFSSTDDY